MKRTSYVLSPLMCILAALLVGSTAFSQDFKLKLPELLPPSPEVSSMIQAGYGNLNRNSGAVSASIPLYELRVNGFSWPISLSYSSQGLKIDEACSRVGNGWTLNANGVISRIVKDDPDDLSTRLPVPGTLGAVDTATLNYAYNVAQSFDSEYDIYNFSFNGYAGKMVFNDANQAILTSHNNLKITRTGWHSFTITATDGVKYFFGDAYERTINHNMDIATAYKNNTRTAYFLTRIELPGGGWINFSYSDLDMSTKTGTSQTITRTAGKIEDPCLVCPPAGTDNFSENVGYVEYRTKLLNTITTSSGQTVEFSYQAKPDLSGDKRLKFMTVSSNNVSLRNMTLDYYDPPGFTGSTTQISRYFLTSLSQFPVSAAGVNESFPLKHEFAYHDLANLGGTPFSKEQDYFGFYNGNSGNLLTAEGPFAASVTINGNRTPNPVLAKKGILTSIKYPTGGYEVFDYEPNTLPVSTVHNYPKANVYMYGFYQSVQPTYTYSSAFFSVPFSQVVPVNLTSYDYDGIPDYTSSDRIVQFYIKQNSDTIIHEWMNGNDNRQIQVTFQPGYSYQVLMRIRNDLTNGGSVDLSYDTTTATYTTWVNAITGGLRLRKISYLDNTGSIAKKKFFWYASADSIAATRSQNRELITQGAGHRRAYFTAEAFNSIWCENEWGSYAVCKMNVLSTSSSYNTQEFDGSNIYYQTVVESDDSLFVNGSTEYTYFGYDAASNNEALRGTDVAATAMGNYASMNNIVETVKTYDKNFALVAEQKDTYEGVSVAGQSLYSYFVQQKYQPILNSTSLQREVDAFNIVRYRHWDRWIRKLKTETKKYEGSQLMTDSVRYVYGTSANVLPQQTITVNSKGQQLKTTQTYPTDAPSTGVFPAMIAANQIAAPYETSFLVDNVLQQQKQVKYKNIHSILFVPDTIRLKAAPAASLTDEQYFRVYDSVGNPLQFNKVSDVSMVYLWDHAKSLVTAQVKNAQLNQVAYSSFEGDSWGNWKPQSGSAQINLDGGYTGSRSFTGTLRDTLSIAGTYIVTAWSNSGAPTLNSTTGTSVITKNGWTLYKWTLTNPTVIAIAGTKIDEVRLYPNTAQMATVTHKPDIGVSAQCDVNNRVTRYEYDGFNRLYRIRDEDNNILKQICYNYAGQPEECGAVVYYSVAKSGTFTRNNCGTNGTGGSVTYTVAAGAYSSTVSQATADQLAQDAVNANGQAYANANGSCSWSNQAQSGNFSRNNCGTNGTGSTVTYTVAAGTYNSSISLADANQQAVNAVNANGQSYANANGSCSWSNQAQSGNFTRNNCGTNGTGSTITYTVAAGTYNSSVSLADANQQAVNAVNANGQSYANANTGCTWVNQAQSGTFTRNNCATGYTGSTVTYTVAANTYSSTVSLTDANQQAINAVNAGGQSYANANGTCNFTCTTGNCTGAGKKCVNNVCETGVQIMISCEYDETLHKYRRGYVYQYSDYSWSTPWYTISPDPCPID